MIEAVFLDRDGTIVEDVGYGTSFDDTHLLPGAAEAIRRLNDRSIPVIVITNQAGVARGYFPESAIPRMHEEIGRALAQGGARIDRWYWCPHHAEGTMAEYAIACDCRKPLPGLLLKAAQDNGLDLTNCVLVGDKASDIGAGVAAGCRTILVMTGHGAKEHSMWNQPYKPDHVAQNVFDAVEWLLADTA